MTEFWESSFIEKQTMWGFEPSDSAILTKDFFLERNVNDILVQVLLDVQETKLNHQTQLSLMKSN
jgi:hypothetical protein